MTIDKEKLTIIGKTEEKPWYEKGLRFKCTQCGQCCTGTPGGVWITEEEAEEIASHLKISIEEFLKQYTKLSHGRLSLRDLPRHYDCVFLKGNKCQIYSVRPKQCRTFPWWPENLESKKSWEATARRCEGINHHEAPLFSPEDITSLQ